MRGRPLISNSTFFPADELIFGQGIEERGSDSCPTLHCSKSARSGFIENRYQSGDWDSSASDCDFFTNAYTGYQTGKLIFCFRD